MPEATAVSQILKQEKLRGNNRLFFRWFEEADYIASFKEIELEQAQHLLQGRTQLSSLLKNSPVRA